MSVEVLKLSSEKAWLKAREENLNSSADVPCLFGVSPYQTEFEMFHRFQGGFKIEQSNEFTAWGQRLQYSIAKGVAEDNGWKIKTLRNVYLVDRAERRGSSYDYLLEIPGKGVGVLEVKNVFGAKFRDEWIKGEDGEIEAPPAIELQVQQQLDLGSRSELRLEFAVIAGLVGGNQVVTLTRHLNPNVVTAIRKKAAAFWERVRTNNPPPPNFEVDHDFITKLCMGAQDGKVGHFEADMELLDLAKEYRAGADLQSEGEKRKKSAHAAMLMKIGDCHKVVGTGFKISAPTVQAKLVEAYERKAYRTFRLTWDKGAES